MLFFVVVCASNPADHLPEHLLTLDRIEFDPALYYLELRDGGEDEIEVETWPQDPIGLNCPRIVRAKDKNSNRPLFFANTKWAIIDTIKEVRD